MKTKRKKPYRSYDRRRWPLGAAMARMGMLAVWGERHPTKGLRSTTKYERFMHAAEAKIT